MSLCFFPIVSLSIICVCVTIASQEFPTAPKGFKQTKSLTRLKSVEKILQGHQQWKRLGRTRGPRTLQGNCHLLLLHQSGLCGVCTLTCRCSLLHIFTRQEQRKRIFKLYILSIQKYIITQAPCAKCEGSTTMHNALLRTNIHRQVANQK